MVGGMLLYIFQSSFIYYPTWAEKHPFPEKTFTHDGKTIRVITLNEGKRRANIYFGANGEFVVYSVEDFCENFLGYSLPGQLKRIWRKQRYTNSYRIVQRCVGYL